MIPILPTPYGAKSSIRHNNGVLSVNVTREKTSSKSGTSHAKPVRPSYPPPSAALLLRLGLDTSTMPTRLKVTLGTLKNTSIPKEEANRPNKGCRT